MAKIVETVYVIKISQLVKNTASQPTPSNFDELSTTLEEVVSGLVSNDCVVEVERA